MKNIIIVMAVPALVAAVVLAQPESPPQAAAAATTSPSAGEVQELREAVRSLTDTVKQLQQQVKDQKTALEKANITATPALPQNQNTPPTVAAASPGETPSASGAAPQLIPTEDTSVVTSSGATPRASSSNANAIPTEDSSVVTSTSERSTISSTGTGGELTQPIGISGNGGKNYMNVSLDAMFALAGSSARDLNQVEVGDHDPQQRGFNARNIELAFDGAVDPYFQGFANIVFKLNNDNNTEVEAEEAFAQTTNLPFNLQLKAGQFFDAFGRLNPTHPHVWEFADAPLVVGRLLGPDGLRGVGTQVSWVLPTPWYAQFLLGVQNGRGGTAYSFRNPGDNGMFYGRLTTDRELRGLGDFLWQPRFETSVDLSPTQIILGGVSGAFGANDTGAHTRTQIYGGDFLYKWKSAQAEGGFPFVKWQTEVMYRRFEAGRGVDMTFPVAETFHDWGLYSQVLWGFKKGWVAGVRGDYYDAQDSRFTDDLDRQSRSRVSANLTWYPTEFSKIRLQYNHDFMADTFFLAGRDVDSVFLQFEFILGAHGAHKF